MSSTNRGTKRIESDAYYTPEPVIENFLKKYNFDMSGLTILEPSAGCGNFCKVIKTLYFDSYIIANEINKAEYDNLYAYADVVKHYDFLTLPNNQHWMDYDIIIGNPPYSLALEFIEKCLEIANNQPKPVKIIMLLRTSFLESQTRYDFWQKHPLTGLYTLAKRPSFINNGKSDSCSYSFFVWDTDKSNTKQTIQVI